MNLKLLTLSFGLAFFATAGARAADLPEKQVKGNLVNSQDQSSSKAFRFNTDDDDKAPKPKVQFSVVDEDKNPMEADPVNSIANDNPYKIRVGYPRWDFVFVYDPQSVSFSQKLSSLGIQPNFSALSLSAFSFLVRLNPATDFFFETEYGQFDTHATASTGLISVNDSTVTSTSVMIRGYGCWLGTTSTRRLCLGAELGSDSTPSLAFQSLNTLEMRTIRDYMVGPSLVFQYPLGPKLMINTKASALLGANVGGQGTDLSLSSDWKIILEGGLSGHFNDRHGWLAAVNYFQRNSNVDGVRSGNPISWTVASASLAGRLAYSFTY